MGEVLDGPALRSLVVGALRFGDARAPAARAVLLAFAKGQSRVPFSKGGVRDALRANFGERSQDDRRVVVVEDVSASNVLDFQVSNAVKGAGQAGQEDGLLPPSFWIEMQARFGNELGSTASTLPDDATVLRWMREKLGMAKV